MDSSRGAQDMALQKNYDNDGDIECWQYGLDTDTVATPDDPDDVVDRQLYSRLIWGYITIYTTFDVESAEEFCSLYL